ncbi:MAG: HAMP domain-containing sensor histidine kinase [Phycisphaeraceae bacterium]
MSEPQLQQVADLLDQLETVQRRLDLMQRHIARSHRLASLGTIAAIIAHEFNNLLTPILSYSQMALAADPPDAELTRKALTKAQQNAEKAAHIVASMLGFTRNPTDDSPAHPAHLATVLDETFHCLARDPAKDRITIRRDVPDNLYLAIPAISLQQVLLNLILNAWQAMRGSTDRKGGTLAVTARALEVPGMDDRRVQLTIADTGPGIPADVLPHLFEPFVTQRQGAETGVQPKGTGLGLTVCRDLIERAGGTITVESTSRGATFIIVLPAPGPRPPEVKEAMRDER